MAKISFSDISIVSCGTMSLELGHLQEAGVLDSPQVLYTTPGLHQDIPELERQLIRQIGRAKENGRHSLPPTLGGRWIAGGATYDELERKMAEGWTVGVTRLTEEYGLEHWRADRPGAIGIAELSEGGELWFLEKDKQKRGAAGTRLIALVPPGEAGNEEPVDGA